MSNRNSTFLSDRPILYGFLIFLLLLTLMFNLSYQRYMLFQADEQKELKSVANDARVRLQQALSYSLSATKTLGYIVEEYGVPENFDTVAKGILADNKNIDVIELLQGGTITHAYPLKGNEKIIGYNILSDFKRNREAFEAMRRKELFFAGPFELKQGGIAVVGRLPIFKQDSFWGFAAVLIRLPTLIKAAKLEYDAKSPYAYQLSKINPETNEEEFFLPMHKNFNKLQTEFVDVPNGAWKLYVTPTKDRSFLNTIPFFLLSLTLSVMGGIFGWYMIRQPARLNRLVEEKTREVNRSEKNYRSTLERLTDGFIALDTDWNFTYINSKAAEALGRTQQELMGKNMLAEFPQSVAFNGYQKAFYKQQYLYEVVYSHMLDKWLENRIYPSPEGVSIFSTDITEKKKAEIRLQESEQKYRLLIEQASDTIFVTDKYTLNLLEVNNSACKLLDYTREELVKKNGVEVLFAVEDVQKLTSGYNYLKKGGVIITEVNLKKKDGTPIAVETSSRMLPDGRILSMMRDIRERKEVQFALTQASERFNLLSKATDDVIWDWDLKTDVIWWNENFYDLFGYERNAGHGSIQAWEKKLHPEDKDKVVQKIHDVIEQKEHYWSDEYRFLKADGSVMYIMDRGYMQYDKNGEPERMIGAMVNLTEYKHAEELVIKSRQELRELTMHLQTIREDERTNIAREIHDELGQQLTGLKMDTSWVLKKLPAGNDELQRKLSGMLALIDDTVKTIRRISSDLRPGILDDLGLVAALEWQSAEFEKRTGLQCNMDSNISEIELDKKTATGIFRIYQESLTNVARHANATKVYTSLRYRNNKLVLSIADNGVGFDNDAQDKNSLGLIGMKERALMFNGDLTIDSGKEKGTTIILGIPLTLTKIL
jgi:PAS domain S-box-containing protein